jgi:predicted TIM-barrel fold metal-dependent hydrolase
MSAPVMNVDELAAIDVHTHVHASIDDKGGAHPADDMFEYFGTDIVHPTVPHLAEHYRERKMACVAFMIDATAATGVPPQVSNEEICELAADHADVVIPFVSVDPHAGAAAVRRIGELVDRHGARGFKFHPNQQAFFPNDPEFSPLWRAIADTGLPVVFHSGHTGVGAGQPGGGGIRLKFSNPMLVDDIAVDFPEMPIVLAHPSFPWQDEALSVALHKPTVRIDLSGWSPKYFPANLIQYANTLLKDRMLFGSDYPVITPDRWLADFAQIPIKDEVRPLILKDNAVRLLGLDR